MSSRRSGRAPHGSIAWSRSSWGSIGWSGTRARSPRRSTRSWSSGERDEEAETPRPSSARSERSGRLGRDSTHHTRARCPVRPSDPLRPIGLGASATRAPDATEFRFIKSTRPAELDEHPCSPMDRAYAILEIKSADDDLRIIEGLATTPTPDRRGDIVEPSGAVFSLPLPLLWQHNQAEPVGEVTDATVTPDGIRIRAKFARIAEPGALRDRLEEAWLSVKSRLVRGLSIGFKPIELAPIKRNDPFSGFHIKRWHWGELSAVTVPMNLSASIVNIKAYAAPGVPLPVVRFRETPMQKTYTEQIAEVTEKRATVLASMNELMTKAGEETLDAEQTKQYDGFSAQVKSLDAHLSRLREMETLNVAAAKPLPPQPNPIGPTPLPVVQVKSNVMPGAAFIRSC